MKGVKKTNVYPLSFEKRVSVFRMFVVLVVCLRPVHVVRLVARRVFVVVRR